ncbi:MAG: hypothetical protein KDA58_05590 [Planctomycetaceae bacterium]|nr:hypothetical protein [Planctomycetaceae bacterium]
MSAEPPLPFRRRTDLIIVSVGSSSPRWTVKDPLTQRFYQLRPAEHFVLQQLDGSISLGELTRRFSRLFAPEQATLAQMMQFVQQLWSQGLLLVDHPAQTQGLVASVQKERGRWWELVSNPLVIRFRGIDPDAFLTASLPLVSWVLTWPVLILLSLFLLASVQIGLSQLPQMLRELGTVTLTGSALVSLLLLVAGIKVCHELGHAFVCKRLGGECRELGVMLLAGTPCLYCNVSDAWLLPNRWKRAAIGAAGMGVELVIAAIATWVWSASRPGLVHALALQTLLLCSVNTLLLNGNPLLRYDGYYILTDLLDFPNLRPRALSLLENLFTRLILGYRRWQPELSPLSTLALLLYGLASWLYLWFVLIMITWAAYRWLQPQGLGGIALMGGAVLLGGRLWSLTHRSGTLLKQAWGADSALEAATPQAAGAARLSWSRIRAVIGTALAALGLIALPWFPWPRVVQVPARLIPAQERSVTVTVPGQLSRPGRSNVAMGQPVAANESLWTLENPELRRQELELQAAIAQESIQLKTLQQRLGQSPELATLVSLAESRLDDARRQLQSHQEQAARLRLVAPLSGRLESGSVRASLGLDGRWRRTAVVDTNTDVLWLDAGTEAARIVSTDSAALLYVPQTRLSAIRPGQIVRLTFPELGGGIVSGQIAEIAAQPLHEVPETLLFDRRLSVIRDGERLRFEPPVHEVRVDIFSGAEPLRWQQQLGTARLMLGQDPVWRHVRRLLREAFW